MKANDNFFFWRTGFVGTALILSGIFFLLTNFSIIPPVGQATDRVIGILLFVTGIVFAFFQGRGGGLFWFIIPAGVSFSFGIVILIFGFAEIIGALAAALLAFGFGTTFLIIFLLQRAQWWALLPAGSLYGLSLWIWMSMLQPEIGFHPVFLILSIGLSFLAVYLFSVQKHKMRFSLYAGAIIVFCAFIYYFVILFSKFILFWAILLIIVGLSVPLALLILNKRLLKKEADTP
jgi:hypothetical protein